MKHRKVLDETQAWAAQKWADQVDHEAFVSLVQALVALEPVTGEKVDESLIQKAGLRHPAGR